ncbi:MAG: isoprenyl transferase [bacterium]|jgi:undecaprenyl diphosphate synthase
MTEKEFKQTEENLKRSGPVPQHVAVIMDGNGRWARKRNLPRVAGHRAGIKSVREVVKGCGALGVDYLTLYTFSTENWSRPKTEVGALMRFLRGTLRRERDELDRNNVRLSAIGRIKDLPGPVRDELARSIEYLSGNTGLNLILALSYSGRTELLDAVRRVAREVEAGELRPGSITESTLRLRLYRGDVPDPDLLIRTSGELRISNFLLWQMAYSELYVTDVLWPDFRRSHLYEAIGEFQRRERRFGGISAKKGPR